MSIANLRASFEKAAQSSFKQVQPRNIALRVERYDINGDDRSKHCAIGTDITTGKKVSIYLRSLSKPLASGHSRLEIADLANSREIKTHVAADLNGKGGVIVFDECRETKEGVYLSSWASTAIHNGRFSHEAIESGFTTMVMAPARFDARHPDKELSNVVYARHAKTGEAQLFACADVQNMTRFMATSLNCPEGEGKYRPEVILRYIDKTDGDIAVQALLLSSVLKKNEDDEYSLLSGANCVAEYLRYRPDGEEHPNLRYLAFQEIVEVMKSEPNLPIEQFAVEIIPVVRRNFGSKARADFYSLVRHDNGNNGYYMKNERTKKGNAYFNRFHKPNEQGGLNKLWYPAHIVTMCAMETKQTANGELRSPIDYRFIKDVTTHDVFPSGYEMTYIPTENLYLEDKLISRFSKENSFVSSASAADEQNDEKKNIESSLNAESVSNYQLPETTERPINLMGEEDEMLMELERLIQN